MKKPKKQRKPKPSKFNGDPQIEPVTIDMIDEATELNMIFTFSNRGMKMLKAGHVFSKSFIKDGKSCLMQFMHRDVYDQDYKQQINLRRELLKQKQAEEQKEAESSATTE